MSVVGLESLAVRVLLVEELWRYDLGWSIVKVSYLTSLKWGLPNYEGFHMCF